MLKGGMTGIETEQRRRLGAGRLEISLHESDMRCELRPGLAERPPCGCAGAVWLWTARSGPRYGRSSRPAVWLAGVQVIAMEP